jgi:hypothetical protein
VLLIVLNFNNPFFGFWLGDTMSVLETLNPFSGFGVASSCPAQLKSVFGGDVRAKNGFRTGRGKGDTNKSVKRI